MDEQAVAKALIDAGLFRVLAIVCTGPIGVYLVGETIKWFAGRKRIERQEELFKCKLYQNKEYICKFSDDKSSRLMEIRDVLIESSRVGNESLKQIENILSDMREDKRDLKELYRLLFARISDKKL